MLLTAPVRSERRRAVPPIAAEDLRGRVNQVRSDIPAVTHVDYSARIQTVDAAIHPRFHAILKAFERRTGCGVIINTSFNVRGEPIVCTLEDAYRCFMTTHIEYLVLGSYLLDKRAQPPWREPLEQRYELTFD
jgi:carbamoyltransferase